MLNKTLSIVTYAIIALSMLAWVDTLWIFGVEGSQHYTWWGLIYWLSNQEGKTAMIHLLEEAEGHLSFVRYALDDYCAAVSAKAKSEGTEISKEDQEIFKMANAMESYGVDLMLIVNPEEQ